MNATLDAVTSYGDMGSVAPRRSHVLPVLVALLVDCMLDFGSLSELMQILCGISTVTAKVFRLCEATGTTAAVIKRQNIHLLPSIAIAASLHLQL